MWRSITLNIRFKAPQSSDLSLVIATRRFSQVLMKECKSLVELCLLLDCVSCSFMIVWITRPHLLIISRHLDAFGVLSCVVFLKSYVFVSDFHFPSWFGKWPLVTFINTNLYQNLCLLCWTTAQNAADWQLRLKNGQINAVYEPQSHRIPTFHRNLLEV